MTSVNFLTQRDIQAAQYGHGMRSSLIDRLVDWLLDSIGGSSRRAVIECINGLFDEDQATRNKSCNELRDLLGYKASNLFVHGVDEAGQFFTEFHPPVYGCDAIRVLRGEAGDKAEYVISRGFVDQEPQAAILDAYFPVHNAARTTASQAITVLLDRYSTDVAKRAAFDDLMEIASPELKGRMSRTATGSIAVNFGLMPLAENFRLDRGLMTIDTQLMAECLNRGVAEDLQNLPPCHQMAADMPRDAYYFDRQPIQVGAQANAGMFAVADLTDALEKMGASEAQLDSLTAVATQRMYGMILDALHWDRSVMIPSTSSHGGMSRFDIHFQKSDKSIMVYHTRKQDICAGLGGMISEHDVEQHYEMMQEEGSAVVKSTETEFTLRVHQDGSIEVIGTPLYAYNAYAPK